MLFIFNATGKIKFRIIPRFKWEHDKRVWYLEISWLWFQSTLYSKEMGRELVQILNLSCKDQAPDTAEQEGNEM